MTCPTDAAIARAFDRALLIFDTSMPWSLTCRRMKEWAEEFDAEPQAVAPYDRCPKCTAHMPVGQTCGGDECGLKRCSHPGCGTPDQQCPCAFDACPRREK